MNTPPLDNLFAAARKELEAAPDAAPTRDELENLLVRGRNLQRLHKPSIRKHSRGFAELWFDLAQRLNQVWRVRTVRYAVSMSICAACGAFFLWNTSHLTQSSPQTQTQELLSNNKAAPPQASIHTDLGALRMRNQARIARRAVPMHKQPNNVRTLAQKNINLSATKVEELQRLQANSDVELSNVSPLPDNAHFETYNGREPFERVFNVQTVFEPNTQAVPRTTAGKQMCAYCPPTKQDIMRLGLPETFSEAETRPLIGTMPASLFRY